MESRERSQYLFGKKALAISAIRELAVECAESDWDGYGGLAIDPVVVRKAEEFIRALPDNLPLPEVSPEPDGSISLDWMLSRNQVVSVSIGAKNRLAFAWLDGSERGHSVVNFDGSTIPARILSAINLTLSYAPATLRAA